MLSLLRLLPAAIGLGTGIGGVTITIAITGIAPLLIVGGLIATTNRQRLDHQLRMASTPQPPRTGDSASNYQGFSW